MTLAYLRDRQLNTPQGEQALTLVNAAMNDAGIASWDAKYAYWDPRPENGVRDLGLDPAWEPYIETPFFPSYISGHATYSGAAAAVLGYLFPDNVADFDAKALRPPTLGCGEVSTGGRTTRSAWTWGVRWGTWWSSGRKPTELGRPERSCRRKEG